MFSVFVLPAILLTKIFWAAWNLVARWPALKIIVVLGHTKCGAVRGACDHVEMGNLTALLTKIRPAVDDESTVNENRNSCNDEFVEKVSTINVKRTVRAIMERSPILKEMIEAGEIGIAGATHDITTGAVTFYEDTLIIKS